MPFSRPGGLNENIQTFGGGTRGFTARATWEGLTDNDLVGGTQTEVLECYADQASFDDSVIVAGAITSVDYRRIMRPAVGHYHTGIPNTGVVFLVTTDAYVTDAAEAFFSLQDMQHSLQNASASAQAGIRLRAAANLSAMGMVIFDCASSGAGLHDGISVNSDMCFVVDTIVINSQNRNVRSTNSVFFYNVTSVLAGADGFSYDNSVTMKNCLSTGSGGEDFGGIAAAAASTHNVSGDTGAPGSNPLISVTVSYVDAPSRDYHVEADHAFTGVDLSADASFPFAHDIDRQPITTWRVGADGQAIYNEPVLTTLWTQVSGPGAAVFADASALDTSVTFPLAGVYELALSADDGTVVVTDTVFIILTGAVGSGGGAFLLLGRRRGRR